MATFKRSTSSCIAVFHSSFSKHFPRIRFSDSKADFSSRQKLAKMELFEISKGNAFSVLFYSFLSLMDFIDDSKLARAHTSKRAQLLHYYSAEQLENFRDFLIVFVSTKLKVGVLVKDKTETLCDKVRRVNEARSRKVLYY